MKICIWLRSQYRYLLDICEDKGDKVLIKRFFFSRRSGCWEEARLVSKSSLEESMRKCVDVDDRFARKLCRYIKKVCKEVPDICRRFI